jgi:prophage regulatory protein
MDNSVKPVSILRIKQVLQKTGIGRSTLYNKIKSREFPPPIKLGERSSGWIASEVDAWLLNRMENR